MSLPWVQAVSMLFFRLLIRLAVTSMVLCTAMIVFSHQPAAGISDLTSWLAPSAACAVPCFLGIRPGITTAEQGVQQLRANPLIRSVAPVYSADEPSTASQLYELQFNREPGLPQTLQIEFVTRDQVIELLLLANVGIQLSDIELAFGQPEAAFLTKVPHADVAADASFYPQYQMYIQTLLPLCSPTAQGFWEQRQNLAIEIASAQNYAELLSKYPNDSTEYTGAWQKQFSDLSRDDCR